MNNIDDNNNNDNNNNDDINIKEDFQEIVKRKKFIYPLKNL